MLVAHSGSTHRHDGHGFPEGLPARSHRANFWPQRFPRAGSQAYPTPAASPNDDGSTIIAFGSRRPSDSPEGNWIQATGDQGWFGILRLYSPLALFFDESWPPSEIEPHDPGA